MVTFSTRAEQAVKGAALYVQEVNRYNVAYRNGFFKAGFHGGWFVKGYRKKDKSLSRNSKVTFADIPLADFSRQSTRQPLRGIICYNILQIPRSAGKGTQK